MAEEKLDKMEYSKIDNIVFGDVHMYDYPDFCDAFIESADYDGKPMTEEEIETIPSEWVYELLWGQLN